jgi:hypothetical protein
MTETKLYENVWLSSDPSIRLLMTDSQLIMITTNSRRDLHKIMVNVLVLEVVVYNV